MAEPKAYRANYSCENCDRDFSEEFDFGSPAPKKATCTHCGCPSGKRKKPAITVAPREPIVIKTEPSEPSYYPVPYYVPTPAPQPYYQPHWPYKSYEVWCSGVNAMTGWQGAGGGNLGMGGAAGSTSCMSSGGMGISMNGGMQ